jgi:hypothetical protein
MRQDDDLSRRVLLLVSQEENAPNGDPDCVGKME